MTALSNLKSIARAATIAVVLGGATMVAAPAMAQSGPGNSFSLELNGGGGGRGGDFETFGRGGNDFNIGFCLTNNQVRSGLREYGFRDVRIVRELQRQRVEVRAEYGRYLYSMRVDKCTGWVDRVERIRRVDFPFFPGNNFGIHLSF